jgi:uncharacterized membrane protein YdjX (TVP38/TMEM64 family)
MEKKIIRNIVIGILIVVILFTISTLLVERYIGFLTNLVQKNYYTGAILFTLAQIIAIVFAPLTSVPLTPIASRTYGFFITLFLVYVGSVIGSILAFIIAKKYGKPFVSKMINIETTEGIFERLDTKYLFVDLILLRIAAPADLLSYSEGIFLKISFETFLITTIIGSIPGSIFFAFLGLLSISSQLLLWLLAAGVIIATLKIIFQLNKREPKILKY